MHSWLGCQIQNDTSGKSSLAIPFPPFLPLLVLLKETLVYPVAWMTPEHCQEPWVAPSNKQVPRPIDCRRWLFVLKISSKIEFRIFFLAAAGTIWSKVALRLLRQFVGALAVDSRVRGRKASQISSILETKGFLLCNYSSCPSPSSPQATGKKPK